MTAAGIHHREGPPVLHGFPCRVSILHTHTHMHTHTHTHTRTHTHTPSPCLSLLLPQLAQEHRMELCPRCIHRVDPAAPGIPLSCVKGGGAEGAKAQASCDCPSLLWWVTVGGPYRSPQHPSLALQQLDSPI